MKRVLQYIFCLSLVLVGLLAPKQAANASGGVHLIISPVNVFLDLKSNDVIEKDFKLENASENATNYKIYASPYTLDDETGNVNFEEETIYSDLKNWITFYDGENYQTTLTGSLAPNSAITIKYKIEVPSNPPAAGQYASIFAETTDDTKSGATASIKANVRIGLNIIAKTNVDKKLDGEIISNEIPNFLLGENVTSTFGVKNSGNVHIDAVQEFRVENIFGELLYEEQNAKIVMPGKTLFTETSWSDSPWVGFYRVSSIVNIPSLDLTSSKSAFVIVIPPVLLAIIIILVAAIATLLIILIVKKRKMHKLRKAVS